MKICQVTNISFNYKKFLRPLCFSLVEDGNDVSVAFNNVENEDLEEKKNINFYSLKIFRTYSPIKHIKSTIDIIKFFKKHKFDQVQIHTPSVAISARIAAFICKVPVIGYTAHGFYFHENMNFLKKIIHITLEFTLAKISTYIMTQSKEDFYTAIRFKFKKKKDIYFIGNGVNHNKYFPATKQQKIMAKRNLKLREESFVISIVARLVKEKGILELYEAVNKLILEMNIDIQLLVCGPLLKSDHKKNVIEETLKFKKIYKDNFIFTGYQENTLSIYHASDIYCLPSWREGMPKSIIEAMMCKLPVIASDIRGCREVVDDNETGILVPPKSPLALKNALKKIIENKKLRIEYGVNGLKKSLEEYKELSYIQRQKNIINNYQNIIDKS